MPTIPISDLDDPRLKPYRDIRNRNWIHHSGLFIAEGPLLVERLLASDYKCHSVLLDEKFQCQYASMIGPKIDLLSVKHEFVESLVGFNFHRGVIGCGLRKQLLSVPQHFPFVDERETIVALVGVQDPENLGSILRTSAALGIKHVLIGTGTADPLARRALRVSMGKVLRQNFYRSLDLVNDLAWLRANRGVESLASSLLPEAIAMEELRRSGPALLLFGNERNGLPHQIQAAADRKIRIDMELSSDSLNVSVAAGILLHYVSRLASRSV